ncbi:MAG: mevalonate kinase [Leptolinea sp.]|jgi:mevalonate kinase|nr:mevalonate kinase [Leptolinea sp.]
MTELLTSASAPGKAILLGEHAVVYGKPALAIPVSQLRVEVSIESFRCPANEIWIDSPVIRLYKNVKDLPIDNPLRMAVDLTIAECQNRQFPGLMIRINSALPIGGGMGSGAAVSCALIRALSGYLDGSSLSLETINRLAFEVEKIHHGNPSGVDNTVITYEQPIYFRRGARMEKVTVKEPIHLVIADTGINSATSSMVGGVRKRYEQNKEGYQRIFDSIETLVNNARKAIESGDISLLAEMMDENHRLLQSLEVSSFSLDRLVKTARSSGALAAKLIGAGGGGNMIALCTADTTRQVSQALNSIGAVRVFSFTLAGEASVT